MKKGCLIRNKGLRPVPAASGCEKFSTIQLRTHGPEARVTLKVTRRKGFLLFEAMIASVILAVAAMGIVSLLLAAQEQQTALQEQSTAVLLAKQLMEEIAAKPFGSATPSGVRSTAQYANQYNGYQDTTNAIRTLSGETISPGDGQTFTRKVTIANAPTPTGSTAPLSDLQLVTVTVTAPSGQKVSLSKLLTNVTWP
jgi:type II secretory pathway pseudopilin PulG